MGVYIPYSRLSSEYQEVEYIENTGATSSSYQYIDTGVNATANIKIELGITPNLSYISENAILGTDWSASTIFLMFYSSKYRLHYGGNYGDASTTITASKQDVVISNTGIAINGETTSISGGSSYAGTGSILLFAVRGFALNPSRYKPAVFKCHGMKMYDGNSLIRDFVPCYRKSDNVIGLYDLVNNQFYTNSGSGTFSKGNDVTMLKLKNAYIGQGIWKPGANTVAYYPLTADTNDAYGNNNMTNSGIVFWTYNGVQCAYLNNNAYASKSGSLFTGNPTFTVSVWMNNIDTDNGEIPWSFGSNGAQTQQFLLWLNGSTRTLNVGGYQNDRDTGYVINRNTWYNVIFAYSPSGGDVYVNGNKVYSGTWSPAIGNSSTRISGDQGGGQLWYGYLSELIFENKKRTLQEASNYYNSTKSNYGL